MIKEMDLIYEVNKKGESQEVIAVIGDVLDKHSHIIIQGQKTNENCSTRTFAFYRSRSHFSFCPLPPNAT